MVSYSRWAGFLLSNTFVTPRQSQRRAAGHHWRSPQQRLRVPTGAAVGIVAGGGVRRVGGCGASIGGRPAAASQFMASAESSAAREQWRRHLEGAAAPSS